MAASFASLIAKAICRNGKPSPDVSEYLTIANAHATVTITPESETVYGGDHRPTATRTRWICDGDHVGEYGSLAAALKAATAELVEYRNGSPY